ncbi:MAG: OmpP1/FadL family transporter [Acidiferrobacter sp.]
MRRFWPVWGTLGLFLTCGGVAHASGFALSELSIAGLSEADAMIANTASLGALAYNPAAMAFHKGGYDLGLFGIDVHSQVQTPGSGQAITATTPHWTTLPDLFWSDRIAAHTRFGFGINEPYGLSIAWPASTFPELTGVAAGLAPTYTDIRLFAVNPNVSYRFGAIAVDVGADYYDAQQVAFDSPAVTITGSGDQVGANVGVLAQFGTINVGAIYRSAANVPLDGNLTEGALSLPVNATLHLPWQAGVGVHDDLGPRVGVEFDFDRTGWGQFTNIVVTPAAGVGGGAPLITSTNDWHSANAYRLGLRYRLSRRVALRAGFAYDQTGEGDSHFSARVPDANREIFSFGATQRLGLWSLSAGYMYVHFNTRTISSTTNLTGTDPNGTSAYNGVYRSHAQLFGISISRRFA